MHDLTLNESAETYILLTVGDGLVAQIPSFFLAMATATIVTRISSDNNDLAGQISKQMGLSKAWVPVSAVLLLFGLVPGMPNTLFLLVLFFLELLLGLHQKLDKRLMMKRRCI